jgi:CubicO group peptidase (beta-lactamase class C family)
MLPAALLAASLALTPAQSTNIDAVVAQAMQASHIPGLSLGVARKGRVVFLRGFGTRDCRISSAANGFTVYRIGSITKEFTAALVMQEAERGALPLSAEVDGITIAQLLSQTSGLVSYTDPGQTLDSAMNAPPAFLPGTQWQYSNSNYYLLGTALESVTKHDYAALLAARITIPLRLTSTTFAPPHVENLARGCRWDGATWQPAPMGENDRPEIAFAASALSSNAPDLLAWLSALYTGAIVSPESFEQMTTSGTLADGTPTHYGFGFFTGDWYGLRIAQHTGFVDGFSSEDALVLDDGTAIALLSNADQTSLVPLAKSIVAIVEPIKDAALVADLSHPAVNEDPAVTTLVQTLVMQLDASTLDRTLLTARYSASLDDRHIDGFAGELRPLGALQQTLFNESTTINEVTTDRYTLVFEHGQLTMTLGLRGGKVDALDLTPGR